MVCVVIGVLWGTVMGGIMMREFIEGAGESCRGGWAMKVTTGVNVEGCT